MLNNSFHRYLLLFMAIFIICFSIDQASVTDQLCKPDQSILCVKDAVKTINDVANNTSSLCREIEKLIVEKVFNTGTFAKHVKSETHHTGAQLPSSHYHDKFVESNNINREYLVNLLTEAHYAISFYYNSVNDSLGPKTVFAKVVDAQWRLIEKKLQNMICDYRSILYVYSAPWSAIKQTPRIRFSPSIYQESPSFIHDVQSMIIAQLLSKWMTKISHVMTNIKSKLH